MLIKTAITHVCPDFLKYFNYQRFLVFLNNLTTKVVIDTDKKTGCISYESCIMDHLTAVTRVLCKLLSQQNFDIGRQ